MLRHPRPPLPLARTHLQSGEIHPGTIQELYDQIQEAFNELPDLFTGNPNQQVFVPVEYQINIFPITDVASANLAIELIVEEGEGIDAPPGFQSHFRRFFDIRDELAAEVGRRSADRLHGGDAGDSVPAGLEPPAPPPDPFSRRCEASRPQPPHSGVRTLLSGRYEELERTLRQPSGR